MSSLLQGSDYVNVNMLDTTHLQTPQQSYGTFGFLRGYKVSDQTKANAQMFGCFNIWDQFISLRNFP